MPYIPHTDAENQAMLKAIGVQGIDTLFDEIPNNLKCKPLEHIPDGLNELQLNHLVKEKAQAIANNQCFLGAGAYEHHIPACVWDITSRGEFLTAYTPYQAEASQGTLQLLYEYQTMMASLTGMDVANASMYDGASALAEAILMAVRLNKKSASKRILYMGGVHPHYLETAKTIVNTQAVELVEVRFDNSQGITPASALSAYEKDDFTAIVIQQPNFFGSLEDVDALTLWAHERGALVIAVVNPMSLALLKAPGEWGETGADIVCGDGQPLGIPLASGGPYFGFLSTKQSFVRQLPGRLVGRTVDKDNRQGFTLTLQAREQHIRRSKATSNICTNQGLLVTAATIYMSVMGFAGLQQTARQCHFNTNALLQMVSEIPGVSARFSSPFFHEVVLRLPTSAAKICHAMQQRGFLAGLDLKPYYPALGEALLVCVTETKTEADLNAYMAAFKQALAEV